MALRFSRNTRTTGIVKTVIGPAGSQIFAQTTSPSIDNPDNSIWIDTDSTDLDVYQLSGGAWTDTGTNLNESAGAIRFNFNTATTDSDKDAGDIWFNNATPASVTTIYFDNTDRDGNTVTTWLDGFDDSTSTINGQLILSASATPSLRLVYNVTGSVTDGTGYRKVVVTHVSGTTLPSDNAQICVVFVPTGDKGDPGNDGEIAGPGVSVDSEIALFSGISGTTLKRATGTGVAVVTSGVFAAQNEATFKSNFNLEANTDYYAPGGTDVALADGGTGTSLVDPGADRIMFWDDSDTAVDWLDLSGLTITGNTLTVDAATESAAGKVELATTTEAATGTDTARAITPAGLRAGQGADRASFSVHKNGTDQTAIADITFTELTWSTEIYDIGSFFASNAWTPPSGKVSLMAALLASGTWSAGALIAISIYKNGSPLKQANWYAAAANNGAAFIATDDVANGTDAYTVRVYVDVGSGTATVSGTAANSYFCGHWIS